MKELSYKEEEGGGGRTVVGDTGEGTALPSSCTRVRPSPATLLPAEGVLGASRCDGRVDFAGMLLLDSGGVPATAPACPPVPIALSPSPCAHCPMPITLSPSPCLPQHSHSVAVPPVAPSITLRPVTATKPAAGAGAAGLPPRGGFLGGTILPRHQMSFLIV